jgi:DNA-binding CsgD family transcriptional regulator
LRSTKEVIVKSILDSIKQYSQKEKKEIISLLTQKISTIEEMLVPISAFNKKLSCFETIIKFLKQETKLNFKQIAKLLNRKSNTIWTTYSNAQKKYPESLDVSDYSCSIPISIFSNRKFSVLELIVSHMKENYDLSIKEISQLLNRNYQTIRTSYLRYKIKAKKKR